MILVSFFSEDNVLSDDIKICYIFEYQSNENWAFWFFFFFFFFFWGGGTPSIIVINVGNEMTLSIPYIW